MFKVLRMLIIEKVRPDIAENIGQDHIVKTACVNTKKMGSGRDFTVSSSVLGGRVIGMKASWK